MINNEYSFMRWEGDDAQPIQDHIWCNVNYLMTKLPHHFKQPDIASGMDGSLCLEWSMGDDCILIDFNADESILIFAQIQGKKYKKTFLIYDQKSFEYIVSLFK